MTAPSELTSGSGIVFLGQLIEVALRAVLIYAGGFVLIRLGKNRLLGRSTPFDIVLGIVLGSLLSRAINGSATIPITIVAASALIGFHTLVSWLSRRSDTIERAIKGRNVLLVRDGEIQRVNMRRADISAQDLDEALRLQAGINELTGVSRARLERNGEISVTEDKCRAPHVIDVHVAGGVQTVRIELA